MLKLYFGNASDIDIDVINLSSSLELRMEDEWFEDPFIKFMIKDIDNTEVINAYTMNSPILGPINYTMLSGGVKMLILAYKDTNSVRGDACGDNCAKWFLEIAKSKDITVSLKYIMKFPETDSFEIEIINTGTIVRNYNEYLTECSKIFTVFGGNHERDC